MWDIYWTKQNYLLLKMDGKQSLLASHKPQGPNLSRPQRCFCGRLLWQGLNWSQILGPNIWRHRILHSMEFLSNCRFYMFSFRLKES